MKINVSRSPDRYSFLKSHTQHNDDEFLQYCQRVSDNHYHKFDDPSMRENNLEYDLLTIDWILQKVRNSDTYAQNLYAAMCNNSFQKIDSASEESSWSVSWRYAGGIIADMQQKGDYIDWYCSGIFDPEATNTNDFVQESYVTDEIEEDLKSLGWKVYNK